MTRLTPSFIQALALPVLPYKIAVIVAAQDGEGY